MRRAGLAAIMAAASLAMVAAAWAQEAPPPAVIYPSEPLRAGPCPVPPAPGWTDTEAWAWSQICSGVPADLTILDGGPWATDAFAQWPRDTRRLSANFLRRILSEPAYVDAITFQGVRIWSAFFDEAVDLTNLKFDKPVQLLDTVFQQPLKMQNYRTDSALSLERSSFHYLAPAAMMPQDPLLIPPEIGLDLAGARIGMNLVMSGMTAHDVRLDDARIDGNLLMQGVTVDGVTQLMGAHIGGTMFAGSAQFGYALKLGLATIEKELRLEDTHVVVSRPNNPDFFGLLAMDSIQINGALLLGDRSDYIDMPQGAEAQPAQADSQPAPPIAGPAGFPSGLTPPDMPRGPLQDERANAPASPKYRFPGRFKFVAGTVNLNGAVIGGELSIRNADIRYFLNLQDARIGDDLWLTTSDINDDDLTGAVIKGYLLLQNTVFDNRLYLDSAEIGRHLIMSRRTDIKGQLQMSGVKLGGDFFGEGARIRGNVPGRGGQNVPAADLRSTTIGGDLKLTRGTTFDKNIDGAFMHIGGSLDLTGGHFASVDLTGAHIAAELRLASGNDSAHLSADSLINLRNVQADSLLDVSGVWPRNLELDGFTYRRFGGAVAAAEAGHPAGSSGDRLCREAEPDGADTTSSQNGAESQGDQFVTICNHTAEQLLEWLGKQRSFSTQPYSHLAAMLRQSGDRETADEIIFEGRKLQWQHAPLFSGTKALMGIEYVFTGFGVHPLRLLYWAVLLIAVGFWVFSRDTSPELRKLSPGQRLIYSIDMLLPVVHLRHHHYEIELETEWARGYLYFHKIMGYVLASLLLAALGGGHEVE